MSSESLATEEASPVTARAAARRDATILTLISTGHFMSHFYFMALPPLFPFLKDAFGVSYTELGALMSLIFIVSSIAQLPVGFLVDRFGARAILGAGLVLMSGAMALMGFAPSFTAILLLGVASAIGNSVFHPCDYAILNSSISDQRMGRAFSAHNFSGQLGFAVAPATMIFLADAFDWRVALIVTGLFGLVVMLALATQWYALQDDVLPRKDKSSSGSVFTEIGQGMRLLMSRQMFIFFLFFAMLSMTLTGTQSFFVAALTSLHGTPLATANAALSAYLLCSAFAVLVGGELSDRFPRHELTAGIVFVVTAVLTALIALVDLGTVGVIALMLLMGFGQGLIRPARDMMLRAAAPKGATGKVFAYVSSGITIGAAIAPLPFGWVIDGGHPEWVFYLISILMVLSLVTVAVPKRSA